MDLGPIKPFETTPDSALKLAGGPELDVFVFRYVFDGHIDWAQLPGGEIGPARPIPRFSRDPSAAKMLMVRLMMSREIDERGAARGMEINFGGFLHPFAKMACQAVTDKSYPVWRASIENYDGYGRRLEEAYCKLAICMKKGGML